MDSKMVLLSEVNEFIRLAEDLYDSMISPKYTIKTETTTEKVGFFKKKEIKKEIAINEKFDTTWEVIKSKIEKLKEDDVLDFITLWQFAQFIRWCDKTIFFKNDIDKNLVVDSDLYNLEERNIVIQKKRDYTIYFKLKMEKNPVSDIFENDSYIKIIEVKIDRLYGKKLSNKYIIANGGINYKDDSDLYCINTVNAILKKSVIDKLNEAFYYLKLTLKEQYNNELTTEQKIKSKYYKWAFSTKMTHQEYLKNDDY